MLAHTGVPVYKQIIILQVFDEGSWVCQILFVIKDKVFSQRRILRLQLMLSEMASGT